MANDQEGSRTRKSGWRASVPSAVYGPPARFFGALALALIPLVLGYFGLHQYLAEPAAAKEWGQGWANVLYYDLQLPVLSSAPTQTGGPYPPLLGIARFLAPAAAAAATLGSLWLLLTETRRRWSAATASGHPVVAGDGPVALEIARNFRAAKQKVVVVSSAADTLTQARRYGALTVQGDPADDSTLRAAGIGRAEKLFSCTGRGTVNADIAVLAGQAPRARKRPLSEYVLVSDGELGAGLQARRIGVSANVGLHLVFFSVEDIAARRLFDPDKFPLTPDSGRPAQLVIIGFGPLGRAVLREAARRQLALGTGARAEVVIRYATAADVTAARRAFPVIDVACTLSYDEDAKLPATGEFTAIVSLDNDEDTLREGLAMAPLVAGGRGRVVICVSGSSPFATALVARTGLFDDLGGRLGVFPVIQEACMPERIEVMDEQLARSIHSAYVAQAKAKGETEATNPSMVPWERLPADLRHSNTAQASDIGAKLETIPAVVIPESADVPEFTFTDQEVERLARLEHERWMEERIDSGWRYGEPRDDKRKVHPALRDWAYLPEVVRDLDRNAIRTLPATLQDAGYQILRLPPNP